MDDTQRMVEDYEPAGPKERKGDWCQTFTGRQYWPLDPRPEDIDPVDVAHHLAMLCRYTGACRTFYSVAEHSVYVSQIVGRYLLENRTGHTPNEARNLALRALLHDGPEFMLGDLNRPTKYSVQGYREIEQLNWNAFCVRFNLHVPDRLDLIKKADNAMLLAEQAVLMGPPPVPWNPIEVPESMLEHAHELAQRCGWSWGIAEDIFTYRYGALTQ